MAEPKPKLAIYWASSCGGCEIAFMNLHERFLDALKLFDLVFCPCLMDAKKKDVEAFADGEIALTLMNGAIRNDENEQWARLLRAKSKILVAFGACAVSGGVPALSNLHSRDSHLYAIYLKNPSTENPLGILPQPLTQADGHTLELPAFHGKARPLAEAVAVDYFIPGCPPESDQIWNALAALASVSPPERGAMLGCGASSVCDECKRARTDKKIERFRRVWEFVPDRDECLLEQGLLCMGVATRSGCGGLCPGANMPCIGCYGPCEGVLDHSAKMISTLGSILDIAPIRTLRDEGEIARLIDERIGAIADLVGVTGRFQMAAALAGRRRSSGEPT